MEKKGNYYSILGLYRENGKENGNYYGILGLYRENGKENGNYYGILGLYRENGKENGNYYGILGLYRDPEIQDVSCIWAVTPRWQNASYTSPTETRKA